MATAIRLRSQPGEWPPIPTWVQAKYYQSSPFVESGRIVLPEVAPWLPLFLKELNYFPNGKYSDQVESFSQALMWLKRLTVRDPPPLGMFVSYEIRAARESP